MIPTNAAVDNSQFAKMAEGIVRLKKSSIFVLSSSLEVLCGKARHFGKLVRRYVLCYLKIAIKIKFLKIKNERIFYTAKAKFILFPCLLFCQYASAHFVLANAKSNN